MMILMALMPRRRGRWPEAQASNFSPSYVKPYACHRVDAYAACHLEEVELDAVEGLAVSAGYHEHVIVIDLFLAVGEFEEGFIGLVEISS